MDKVKRILDSVDPRAIEKAGDAYLNASSTLEVARRAVEDAGKAMADVWGGKASVKAQQALRSVHGALEALGDNANRMGRPLQSLGKTVIPSFKDSGGFNWDDGFSHNDSIYGLFFEDGGVSISTDNKKATEHLKELNKALGTWHDLLPASLTEDLPKLTWPTPDQNNHQAPKYPTVDLPDRGNPNYSPDPNGNLPQDNGPTTGPKNGNNPNITDPNATDPNAVDPNATDPNATDPNAVDPNATDPNVTDPNITDPNANGPGNGDVNGNIPGIDQPGTNPSLNPGGLNGVTNPNGTDPRSTGLSDYQPPKLDTPPFSTTGPNASTSPTTLLPAGNPSATVPGVGTVPGTGPGTNIGTNVPVNTNGANLLRAGGNTTGMPGMGMPFMPMGGMGAGGGEERTSETSTWLVEDDDVWGGPAKDVVDDTIR
ncbi:WXG100 family type VII secretion target [Nonomuraea cavernae]|uniref:WXG100 family type VII secretion target n=1 Tax=Nonomuraea cavernae TaxID=2045107 RepID=UPI00166E531E|nr:WXG100 family type VII secretion target [Nonomuraea cavernae]MCA2190086.1 hypothetical protein [Nonomuraea cavernae]